MGRVGCAKQKYSLFFQTFSDCHSENKLTDKLCGSFFVVDFFQFFLL